MEIPPRSWIAFGDRIYQFRLFAIMLIEQQVELIKSWPGNLPMRFLVEITQSHGIGQQEVELFGHLETNGSSSSRGSICETVP